MKKSDKLKRKTIKMVVKNLIVFVVLIAVAAVGVRSWLNWDDVRKADAKGFTGIKCSVPEGLEVAILPPGGSVTANTVWHDESFSINADDYNFLNALSFTEITSDGKTFIKPKIVQYGSVAVADTNNVSSWGTATANSEYLSFDMMLRSTASTAVVSLDKESYCGPEASTQEWGNSLNGWSPHTVIGAARVAVLDADTLNNLKQKLLWIPAPFLHFDPVSNNGDAQLKTQVTDTSNNYGLAYYDDHDQEINNHDGTYNHGYYSKSGNTATHQKIVYDSNVANAGSKVTAYPPVTNGAFDANKRYHLPYDVPITDLFSTGSSVVYDSVSYFQHRVRVNIWIEGEDPESRAAQVTGQFYTVLNLKLSGN